MKIQFISTVVGPLGPDVLKSLATLSRECGAEWLSSKLIMLDGQFAAMMRVSIDDDKDAQLRTRLEQAFPNLSFVYAPVVAAADEAEALTIELDCSDRPGLTRDINDILANLGIGVTQMESHRLQVTSLGRTVFNANMQLKVPAGVDTATLVAALEAVEPNARVYPKSAAV
jgi:glycine cleavage system regulatory protein